MSVGPKVKESRAEEQRTIGTGIRASEVSDIVRHTAALKLANKRTQKMADTRVST